MLERHRVADALRAAAALVGVVTHRVLVEVAVERGAILRAQRARRQAEHFARPLARWQIERGELGGDQRGSRSTPSCANTRLSSADSFMAPRRSSAARKVRIFAYIPDCG